MSESKTFTVKQFLRGDIVIHSRTLEERKAVLERLLTLLPPDKTAVYPLTRAGMDDPAHFARNPELVFDGVVISGTRIESGERTLSAEDFLAQTAQSPVPAGLGVICRSEAQTRGALAFIEETWPAFRWRGGMTPAEIYPDWHGFSHYPHVLHLEVYPGGTLVIGWDRLDEALKHFPVEASALLRSRPLSGCIFTCMETEHLACILVLLRSVLPEESWPRSLPKFRAPCIFRVLSGTFRAGTQDEVLNVCYEPLPVPAAQAQQLSKEEPPRALAVYCPRCQQGSESLWPEGMTCGRCNYPKLPKPDPGHCRHARIRATRADGQKALCLVCGRPLTLLNDYGSYCRVYLDADPRKIPPTCNALDTDRKPNLRPMVIWTRMPDHLQITAGFIDYTLEEDILSGTEWVAYAAWGEGE